MPCLASFGTHKGAFTLIKDHCNVLLVHHSARQNAAMLVDIHQDKVMGKKAVCIIVSRSLVQVVLDLSSLLDTSAQNEIID